MAQQGRFQFAKESCVRVSASILLATYSTTVRSQNITLDETLGAASTLAGPVYAIPQNLGTTVRNNLFYSFSQFNLSTGESANFQRAADIRNIFARVTGGAQSSIDGLIRTEGGNINLFLINPSGILFGPNATLNIGDPTRGSFVATTVDAILFPNGDQFSATNPGNSSGLLNLVGDPSGFLASQRQPGIIQIFGSVLGVYGEQSLVLLGGDLSVDSENGSSSGKPAILGINGIQGGRIELGSIAGAGIVQLVTAPTPTGNLLKLTVPNQLARGDVSFRHDAEVNAFAESGGSISIHARNIKILEGSRLLAGIGGGLGATGNQAGDITLDATGEVTLSGRSLAGKNSQLLNTVSGTDSVGNAGNILITARSLSVTDGGEINSSTFGQGNAGDISINSSAIFLDAGFQGGGIFTTVEPLARGEGGSIFVSTETLSLAHESTLNVSTQGQGNSGSIVIDTRSLAVTGGAKISASSRSNFNAGDVLIDAKDKIRVDGFGVDQNGQVRLIDGNIALSQIISGVSGSGQGGGIHITTESLAVTNGGQLTANTFGLGKAGNIFVDARDEILLNGRLQKDSFDEPSGLFARTTRSGQAGNIILNTPQLLVEMGAQISASTSGIASGGNINLQIRDTLTLRGTNSGIVSNTKPESFGNGGSIVISPRSLTIRDGAQIAVNSDGRGKGGDIIINARSLDIDNGQIIAESAASDGGDIFIGAKPNGIQFADLTVTPPEAVLLRHNSLISATAGNNQNPGNGGNITINSPFVIGFPDENSDIIANAFSGTGGNININAAAIINFQLNDEANLDRLRSNTTNDISASSQFGGDGTLNLTGLGVDPTQGTTQLPTDPSSPRPSQGCQTTSATGQASQGEFFVTGRGGLPPNPSAPLTSTSILDDLRLPPGLNASQAQVPSSKTPMPSPLAEATHWDVNAQGQIILAAKPTTSTQVKHCKLLD